MDRAESVPDDQGVGENTERGPRPEGQKDVAQKASAHAEGTAEDRRDRTRTFHVVQQRRSVKIDSFVYLFIFFCIIMRL